jgi:hypothetical protein
MKVAFVSTVALVSYLMGGACTASTGAETAETATSSDGESDVTGRAVTSHSVGWQPVYVGQASSQSIQYGRALDPGDPTQLLLKNELMDEATGQWSSETFEFAASFEIIHVSSAKQDRLYLLGLTGTGESVIERWKRGTTKAGTLGGGGGTLGYVMKRTELYRGATLGVIRWIGADPLERYILLIHGSGAGGATLSRMTLPSGQSIQPLWNANQVPNLKYITGGYPQNHLSQGRLWILSVFGTNDPLVPEQRRTILYDSEDDGILDSTLTVDEMGWEAMGYTQDVWDGDFVIDLGW